MSGIGLDTAFNQDPPTQNINTHAKQDKQAEGLKDEKKNLNLERIYDAKIGETVSYNATTGTIVRKDGSYVTIYNEGNNAFDQVHAGQTSISTDTIGSGITAQLWDQMRQEQRVASLNKAHIEEPLHFISRKWSELPANLKDVLKTPPVPSPRAFTEGPNESRQFQSETEDLIDRETMTQNKPPSERSGAKSPVKKFNPDSEPGKKMPGTATNKPTEQTMTPQGRNVLIGNTGNKLNTGQTRTFTPGGKKPGKKESKPASEQGQRRARSTGATNERKRGQEVMSHAAQSGLDIMTAGKKQDEGVTFASCKSTEYISKLSPSFTSVGSGYKGKVPEGASRDKPTGSKKPGSKGKKPADNSLLGQHEAGKQEQHVRNHLAVRNAPKAGLDIMTSKKPKPKDEGVTFATGLDKANNYSDLATVIYRIRNNINKITGTKIPHEKFGDLPVGKPDGKVGGTKIVTPEGEKTLKNPADSYGFVSEKKSDVEHGAYGGVVTDTEFDAPEDYEEKRPKVDGKEFDHNHQQKTPRDPKEDGKEVMVGYHNKEGDGGAVTTGTPGANNPRYNAKYDPDEDGYKEKAIRNKNNTRYGPRTATKEEIYKYLNK